MFDPDLIQPPPPLYEEFPSGGSCFSYREGARIVLRNRKKHPPHALFIITLAGSYALDGQPIRCSGIEPGISLRIEVKIPHPEGYDPDDFLETIWLRTQPIYAQWLADPRNLPGVEIEFEKFGIHVQFARDALLQARPSVMQIDLLA